MGCKNKDWNHTLKMIRGHFCGRKDRKIALYVNDERSLNQFDSIGPDEEEYPRQNKKGLPRFSESLFYYDISISNPISNLN